MAAKRGLTPRRAGRRASGITPLTNVANGPHTLMVEASDKAGNKTTQKLDFIIDTLLSEPTITPTVRMIAPLAITSPTLRCRLYPR